MTAKPDTSDLTAWLNARAERARWLKPLVRSYWQGFADRRQSGTRHGPVHLFDPEQRTVDRNGYCTLPLCGRRVKRWTFEGETDDDFCPRCVAVAQARAAAH